MISLKQIKEENAAKPVEHCVAVIPGGTSGIGAGLAIKIASYTKDVTIHLIGRSEQGAHSVISRMKEVNPNGNYIFHQCDLSLIQNTKAILSKLKAECPKINYLILSQGFLSFSSSKTQEGLEKGFAVMIYSRMAFAQELSASLVKASEVGEEARILHVLNSKQVNFPKVDFDDLGMKGFSLGKAFAHVFSLVDAFLQDLVKRVPIAAMHAYPGFVESNIGRDSILLKVLGFLMSWKYKSADDCGDYLYSALLNPDYRQGFHPIDEDGSELSAYKYATEDQQAKVKAHFEEIWESY